MTDPPFCHPQGLLVVPTHAAVHLGSGGLGLGRQSQESSRERAEGTRWRVSDAASLRGRCAPVVGPVAVGERSARRVTASTLSGGRTRYRPLLALRTAGGGAGVRLCAMGDPGAFILRMVGVAADRFLAMVTVWLLPA